MIQKLFKRLRDAPWSRALYRLIVRFIDAMPKHTPSRQKDQQPAARPVRFTGEFDDSNHDDFGVDFPPRFLHAPDRRPRAARATPPPPPTAVPAGPPRRTHDFYRQFLLPPPPPRTRTLTVFVRGAHRAGKTTFIRSICDTDVRGFPPRHLPNHTTLRIEDFGRIHVHDDLILDLVGTENMHHDLQLPPGVRCDTYSGTIFLVDSTSSRYVQVMHEWWQRARQHTPPPYVTALTKADEEQPVPPDQLRRYANVPSDELMLPCIATSRDSVHHIVSTLLEEIMRWLEMD